MKKLVVLFLLIAFYAEAQTGIGTTTPNASAKLDVFSTNKGFLPPRVTLTSVSDATTIASPAEGLLVYNLGSVGLQAGYYYWNGANWATIATATSAGNGVASTDLVKLYQEGYSTTSGKAASTSGYSFTVPVSGRYEFNFNSTGWNSNGSILKLTFYVRNGTTVLGSDYHQSTSSNVWAEYEGRVEVNLNAGETYNVQVVTTTGSRDYRDYDKIMYKMVAGNLPVTGQSVDYVSVSRTTLQTVNTGDNILFNSINSGNIPYNSTTGNFTLTAGKTYRLTGSVSLDATTSASSEIDIAWKNAAGDILGNKALILSANFASPAGGNGITDIIYTPTVNTTIALNVIAATANAKTIPNYTYANVEQIGSSAYVTPWTLSGTSTYNTTGNVGIGTTTPTTTLDVTGNVNVTGKINLTDPTGNVVTKAAAFVARGEDVILGNLKVRLPATGNISMQVSSVSGTFSIYGSTLLVAGGAAGFSISGASPLVVTTTPAYLRSGANFTDSGWSDMWILRDTSNSAVWRLTHLPGVNNINFISIERLL